MNISKYLKCIVKEFIEATGSLMVITIIFLTIYSKEIIKVSLLWQIILISLAYTFFKFAFVNKYELGKRAQTLSFTICSLLADIMIILWLWLFSPGKIANIELMIIYIVVVLIVKGMVYIMMCIDGNKQAKQLNEKLSEYRKIL